MKHWIVDLVVLLLIIGTIISIHHQKKDALELKIRQRDEGFAIAAGGIGCCLFFVWRLARFFAKDEQRVEMAEEKEAPGEVQPPPRNTTPD